MGNRNFKILCNKNSEIANDFYATIQNKFHYAITNETATEIIYHRAENRAKRQIPMKMKD